jgi:hypothetical protein
MVFCIVILYCTVERRLGILFFLSLLSIFFAYSTFFDLPLMSGYCTVLYYSSRCVLRRLLFLVEIFLQIQYFITNYETSHKPQYKYRNHIHCRQYTSGQLFDVCFEKRYDLCLILAKSLLFVCPSYTCNVGLFCYDHNHIIIIIISAF